MGHLIEPIDWESPINPILETGTQVIDDANGKIWIVKGRGVDGVILKRVGASARRFFDIERSVAWFELARDFSLCSSRGQRNLLMKRHRQTVGV